MKSWFNQLLSYFVGQFAYQFFMRKVKKTALMAYLKTLRIVRQSLLATVLILVALQLMVFGLIGMVVTGVWLCPTNDVQTKLWILLIAFSVIFLIPCLGLFLFFSEKNWLRVSGAEKLLNEQS